MAEITAKLDVVDRLLDYRVVEIGKQQFEVRNPDALNPLDYRWIFRKYARIGEIENIDSPTEAERAEYTAAIDRMCRIILSAPDEVHASLTDLQRIQILLFFVNGSSTAQRQQSANVKTSQKGRRQHGKKRSRG